MYVVYKLRDYHVNRSHVKDCCLGSPSRDLHGSFEWNACEFAIFTYKSLLVYSSYSLL